MKKFLLLILALFLFLPQGASAAGLFEKSSGPKILIAEVQSYGDYELKAAYLDSFVDKLTSLLNQEGIATVGRSDLTNEAGRHDALGSSADAARISEIHMDAIVHGHQFNRGYAAAKLAHYADRTMGRAYFHDEEKLEAWRKNTEATYALSSEDAAWAQRLAQNYGASYLLFVNLKDVDVRLKGGIFATHTERETKGKKMKSTLDYYLVKAETGRVYEGHIESKKSAQMINFGLGKTGKGMNVETLLSQVMDTQTEEIAENVKKKISLVH